MTIFVAVVAVALLLVIGLVADGGAQLRAAQRATALAEEAARAGAQAVNAPQVMEGGPVALDSAQAVNAATAYLDAAGASGQVTIDSATTVTVEVTTAEPTVFLSLIGIDELRATSSATARAASGVTGDQP